jgi:hypothetical protein
VGSRVEPVGARKHQVEDDYVGTEGTDESDSLVPVSRGPHFEAFLFQDDLQSGSAGLVVLDEQDLAGCGVKIAHERGYSVEGSVEDPTLTRAR